MKISYLYATYSLTLPTEKKNVFTIKKIVAEE
jgi:hypothetical protein